MPTNTFSSFAHENRLLHQQPETADEWLQGSTPHEGSWWSDWAQWVADYNGKQVAARQPGDGKLQPIEDAPGRYVKARLV